MIRLFTALKIPKHAVKKIIEIRNDISAETQKYKWENEDKIHLTLKFIGSVDGKKVKPISETLKLIENYKKFNLSVTHFGIFFKMSKPVILWAELSENHEVIKLAAEINNKLELFSVPADKRKFKSHLTLLRIKNRISKDFIEKFENCKIPKIDFIAEEAALFKSSALPQGSIYTEIKNYKLK